MRPRLISEEEFTGLQANVRGRQGKHLTLHGANDEPVPSETGNTVRSPQMARNKAMAPVSLRGKSVDALGRAGRGEAYSSEAGRATKLRTKESERRTNAGARPAPAPFAPYANKWEFNFAKVLDLQLRAKEIRSWQYAGITFTLAKKQYHRIDFIIGHNDFSVEIAQVKGYHPNMRAAIKGLKWAAQKWPMFTWTIKRWTGTGWDSSYVEV